MKKSEIKQLQKDLRGDPGYAVECLRHLHQQDASLIKSKVLLLLAEVLSKRSLNERQSRTVARHMPSYARALARVGVPSKGTVSVPQQEPIAARCRKKPEKLKPLPAVDPDVSQRLLEFGELYPFQVAGVNWIDHCDGRALIADDMGLGKTIQALAWLWLHPEARPAVIVTPASVKLKWEAEIHRWMPGEEVEVLSGMYQEKEYEDKIYILNFDIFSDTKFTNWTKPVRETFYNCFPFMNEEWMWVYLLHKISCRVSDGWGNWLKKLEPECMVIDECQYIQNDKSARTKAVVRVGRKTPFITALSGTPITSRPSQFHTILNLIAPGIFGSKKGFLRKFCDPKWNGFGMTYKGVSNVKLLRARLSKIMIRRLKKDVLKELPNKVRSVIPLEITNRSEYDKADADFKEWLKTHDATQKATALNKIEKLKQLAVAGKMRAMLKWLDDYLDVEGKVVVFATHKATIKKLNKKFPDAVVIDGGTPQDKRLEIMEAFQFEDGCRVFLGNIKAAGVGLDLTAASATVHTELAWNPADHEQAEDRVHRIGQEADSVMAYYFIAMNTVEEKIWDLIEEKRDQLGQVLDGKSANDNSVLKELIKEYQS